MTDLLLTTILVGAAVTFVLELMDALSFGILTKQTINGVFSLPLSFAGIFAMQQILTIEMFVTVPAATLVSLVMVKYLNKPQQVDVRRVPRI